MTCKCGHPQHWHNGANYRCTLCTDKYCTRLGRCDALGHEPCRCTEYRDSGR